MLADPKHAEGRAILRRLATDHGNLSRKECIRLLDAFDEVVAAFDEVTVERDDLVRRLDNLCNLAKTLYPDI